LCRYARELAAESLRRNENDIQKALDILTDPKVNSTIQAYIESRKRKRQEQLVGISVAELVSMGFERGKGKFPIWIVSAIAYIVKVHGRELMISGLHCSYLCFGSWWQPRRYNPKATICISSKSRNYYYLCYKCNK